MKVVVLGASRGLGLALCRHLAQRGHKVLAGARGKIGDELLSLTQQHPQVAAVVVDVSKEEEMIAAAEACRLRFGQVDHVVFNAGVLLPEDRTTLLHELPLCVLRETLDINVVGAVSAIKHFYPLVAKKETSSFVLITSEGCDIKSSGSWVPAYGLSKCAETKVAGIMNASVKDLRFYAVHPGRMNTDMGRTTQQIEPEETAQGLTDLLENGRIHSFGSWYLDYKGKNIV